jgi:proteasome assembly chaperone (PAC2) family protein
LDHLKIHEMPSAPTQLLVTALAGWADAGEAATAALRRLAKQFDATKFADLDPEEFYDFSQVRPYTSLTREGLRRIRWPANELFYSPTAMSGAGALLFLGVEPSLKWRTYSESIIDLGKQCGVSKVVHVGALLDAVPHTREILLTGSSNNKDMIEALEDHSIRRSRYQGPTGITSALMEACSKRDISFTTLWGHTPHYLHAAPNYTVSHALVKALSSVLAASLELGELEEASVTYHEQVSSAVIEDSQLSSYIEKLEERYDTAELSNMEIPQPDEVVRDLEDFLKERQRRFGGGASDD